MTVSKLAASRNTADSGVLAIEATVVLTQVAASQNVGAGVLSAASAVHIDHSVLDGNHDSGVSPVTDNVPETNGVTVVGSTIAHTTPRSTGGSALGRGILVAPGGSASVSDSTLDGNTNFGMAVVNGVGRITSSTISGTRVGPVEQLKGGLFYSASVSAMSAPRPSDVADVAATAGLIVTGTIDADNAVPDCAGTIGDGGYNLDSDGSCHLSAAGSHSHATADLGKLTSNGGPTKTLLPGFASAARNAIPFRSAGCVTGAKNQRGLPRRSPAAGRCDIGSVEAAVIDPTLHIKIAAPHRSHGWYRGRVTLTYACKVGSAPLTHACPKPTIFKSSSRNHHARKTITGLDGGRATVTVSGIKIDRTKPHITITGVKNGHTYQGVRQIHRKCRDSFSGIATCQLHIQGQGSTVSYVVAARDRAGNVHRVRGRYYVGR